MKNYAVIGANYGDEGKGLYVDYFCNRILQETKCNPEEVAVVRFQGSCQAGHTVQAANHKHVFRHFGSGTLLGCPTILGPRFVCNPHSFLNELKVLNSYSLSPVVFADPNCYITTAYEVMINILLERKRGENKHGSCGMGFGETIEREEVNKVSLKVADMFLPIRIIINKLKEVRANYFLRCAALNINPYALCPNDILETVYKKCMEFAENIYLYHDRIDYHKYHVFEGAQGLKLDMNSEDFPYVTRSKTDLTYALEFCKKYDMTIDEAVLVSRPYATRHGRGPLPFERKSLDFIKFTDETNVYNEFQEGIRLGLLNLSWISNSVTKLKTQCTTVSKAFTCLNQINNSIEVVGFFVGTTCKVSLSSMLRDIKYASFSPTREHVVQLSK